MTKGQSIHRSGNRKFEEWWTKNEDCGAIISEIWSASGTMPFQDKLSACMGKLKAWSWGKFGDTSRKIKAARWTIKKFEAN